MFGSGLFYDDDGVDGFEPIPDLEEDFDDDMGFDDEDGFGIAEGV